MSRERSKVFSILITITLLRRVTIIIAFIITLTRSKERRLFAVNIFLVVGVVFRLSSIFVRIPAQSIKDPDLSYTLYSQQIYSIR